MWIVFGIAGTALFVVAVSKFVVELREKYKSVNYSVGGTD